MCLLPTARAGLLRTERGGSRPLVGVEHLDANPGDAVLLHAEMRRRVAREVDDAAPGVGPAHAARQAAASASALIGAKIRGILRSRRGFIAPESTEVLDEMLMAKLRRTPGRFVWPAARKRGQISAIGRDWHDNHGRPFAAGDRARRETTRRRWP